MYQFCANPCSIWIYCIFGWIRQSCWFHGCTTGKVRGSQSQHDSPLARPWMCVWHFLMTKLLLIYLSLDQSTEQLHCFPYSHVASLAKAKSKALASHMVERKAPPLCSYTKKLKPVGCAYFYIKTQTLCNYNFVDLLFHCKSPIAMWVLIPSLHISPVNLITHQQNMSHGFWQSFLSASLPTHSPVTKQH